MLLYSKFLTLFSCLGSCHTQFRNTNLFARYAHIDLVLIALDLLKLAKLVKLGHSLLRRLI